MDGDKGRRKQPKKGGIKRKRSDMDEDIEQSLALRHERKKKHLAWHDLNDARDANTVLGAPVVVNTLTNIKSKTKETTLATGESDVGIKYRQGRPPSVAILLDREEQLRTRRFRKRGVTKTRQLSRQQGIRRVKRKRERRKRKRESRRERLMPRKKQRLESGTELTIVPKILPLPREQVHLMIETRGGMSFDYPRDYIQAYATGLTKSLTVLFQTLAVVALAGDTPYETIRAILVDVQFKKPRFFTDRKVALPFLVVAYMVTLELDAPLLVIKVIQAILGRGIPPSPTHLRNAILRPILGVVEWQDRDFVEGMFRWMTSLVVFSERVSQTTAPDLGIVSTRLELQSIGITRGMALKSRVKVPPIIARAVDREDAKDYQPVEFYYPTTRTPQNKLTYLNSQSWTNSFGQGDDGKAENMLEGAPQTQYTTAYQYRDGRDYVLVNNGRGMIIKSQSNPLVFSDQGVFERHHYVTMLTRQQRGLLRKGRSILWFCSCEKFRGGPIDPNNIIQDPSVAPVIPPDRKGGHCKHIVFQQRLLR